MRLPRTTFFLKPLTRFGMPWRLSRTVILLARAVTEGPLVKIAWETAVQVLSGIEVGEMVGLLLGLKATARICSSRMWSTSQRSPFPGFWVCLGSLGWGRLVVVVVSAKTVKEAEASTGPGSSWYHVAVDCFR